MSYDSKEGVSSWKLSPLLACTFPMLLSFVAIWPKRFLDLMTIEFPPGQRLTLPVCLQFVSEFTENKLDGHKLERVYLKIKSGKATNAAVHNVGAGVNGEALIGILPYISRAYSEYFASHQSTGNCVILNVWQSVITRTVAKQTAQAMGIRVHPGRVIQDS